MGGRVEGEFVVQKLALLHNHYLHIFSKIKSHLYLCSESCTYVESKQIMGQMKQTNTTAEG